ncbi:F-box domain-containing protein [Mycena chlorophos]|uniref:F-box domain-containing protein n=1 Tax=Mycena chlorophos TaxID=658473 RepID=A0A8H6WCX5_MYCCL|nr:F-box domain-containing protein [Mycena chlorophos]
MASHSESPPTFHTLPFPDAPPAIQRAVLSALQAQIRQTKIDSATRLAELSLQKTAAYTTISIGSKFYPVLSLPHEIISAIFVACLPIHGRVRPSKKTAPWILTQVCRDWRAVALSTTELWVSLDLELSRQRDLQTGKRVVVLKPGCERIWNMWLSRAGSRPLSLTLRQKKKNRTPADTLLPYFLRDFKFARQLQRLEADISPSQFRWLIPANASLKHLTHLAVGLDHTTAQTLPGRAAPLTSLVIREHLPNSLPYFLAPTLTRIEIGRNLALADFYNIISLCPLLVHFKGMVKATPAQCDPIRYPSVILPEMISLQINTPYASREQTGALDCVRALEILTLPNLRTLHINVAGRAAHDLVAAFLSRSACSIQELHLEVLERTYHPKTAWKALETFELFPATEKLSVHLFTDCSQWFPWFKPEDFDCMPNLRDMSMFILDGDQFYPVHYREIRAFLAHRRRDPALQALEKLHITAFHEEGGTDWFPSKMDAFALRRLLPIDSSSESDAYSVEVHTFDHETGEEITESWPQIRKPQDPCAEFELNEDIVNDFVRFLWF